jgi:hypothetical protein
MLRVQNAPVLRERIGNDRVDLGLIYFVREIGQEEEHDCCSSNTCAIEGVSHELIYGLF